MNLLAVLSTSLFKTKLFIKIKNKKSKKKKKKRKEKQQKKKKKRLATGREALVAHQIEKNKKANK